MRKERSKPDVSEKVFQGFFRSRARTHPPNEVLKLIGKNGEILGTVQQLGGFLLEPTMLAGGHVKSHNHNKRSYIKNRANSSDRL